MSGFGKVAGQGPLIAGNCEIGWAPVRFSRGCPFVWDRGIWVGSRSKCNGVEFIWVGPEELEVEVAGREEDFCGGIPAEGFSDSGIEFNGDFVQVLLTEAAEVFSFGLWGWVK
jgi:hypothetical protein